MIPSAGFAAGADVIGGVMGSGASSIEPKVAGDPRRRKLNGGDGGYSETATASRMSSCAFWCLSAPFFARTVSASW